MEVRIGVQNVAREIVLESSQPGREIRQLVEQALTNNTPLSLQDERGETVIVPISTLAYVDIAAEQKGRVGFGG